VSPAPLPPHERPWRHPSELAPTRYSIEPDPHRYVVPLLVGTVTIVVVAALVVAMTPSPRSEPLTLSGTTTPARITRQVTDESGLVPIAVFTPIPNAVAAIPTFSTDSLRYATRLPHSSEVVIVQTAWATYRLLWRDVQFLHIDGQALIADETLALVGYMEGPHFYPTIQR
jgi:hypothetical protein